MRRLLCLAGLALGGPSGADDIIMKSGEVIEGRVDRAATDAANRGKKNPDDAVLVVATDERGTQRTIRHGDVKYVVPKKPSWEVHKDNLAWYEAAKDKQKDTAASWENFGRQCRSKKLDEQAEKAFRRAYELKVEELKAKDTVNNHLDLAKWCHKNGLVAEENQQMQSALKGQRAAIDNETDPAKRRRGLLDLAASCRKYDLPKEAQAIYEEILKEDPANSVAKAALEEIRATAASDVKRIIEDYEKAGRAWKLTVAIEDDASPQVMAEWKARLERLSTFIFEITEGQFFVSEWRLEDQSSNGKIIIDKGKLDWESMSGPGPNGVGAYTAGPGSPQWVTHAPGKAGESVLCHEMFHGIFGMLDEYYQNPMCPCIMAAAPNPQKICTPQTHIGGGAGMQSQQEPCWDTIRRRFKDVVWPNPNWKFTKTGIKPSNRLCSEEVDGELTIAGRKFTAAPACNVIVIDR